VVADRRDVEADEVERLDGGLVVERGRQQRCRPDQIAGGDRQGRRAAPRGLVAQSLEVRREVLDAACGHVAVGRGDPSGR